LPWCESWSKLESRRMRAEVATQNSEISSSAQSGKGRRSENQPSRGRKVVRLARNLPPVKALRRRSTRRNLWLPGRLPCTGNMHTDRCALVGDAPRFGMNLALVRRPECPSPPCNGLVSPHHASCRGPRGKGARSLTVLLLTCQARQETANGI
jgi:hypothetical protein